MTLTFFGDGMLLPIIFGALVAVIIIAAAIIIGYFVMRNAVRRGIDRSETAKIYRALAEQELREKYECEDEE